MELMKELDPHVDERVKRKLVRRIYWTPGPDHSWHMDG